MGPIPMFNFLYLFMWIFFLKNPKENFAMELITVNYLGIQTFISFWWLWWVFSIWILSIFCNQIIMTNLLHTTLRKTRRRTKNVVAWLGSCTQWQHSLSHIMFKTGKEMRKALHYLKATLGHKLASPLPTNHRFLINNLS